MEKEIQTIRIEATKVFDTKEKYGKNEDGWDYRIYETLDYTGLDHAGYYLTGFIDEVESHAVEIEKELYEKILQYKEDAYLVVELLRAEFESLSLFVNDGVYW